MSVSETIRQQLGNKFVVMTGSRDFVSYGRGLSFRIGKNAAGVTHIAVNLNAQDLYDVEFMRYNDRTLNLNRRYLPAAFGVSAEQLANVIGDKTGMAISL